MAIEYFNAYHSYLKSIEPLNDAERGRLFTALLEYSSTGTEPDLRGNERFIFPTMREQIDRDVAKYEVRCKTNAENGRMGGRPPKPKKPNGFLENPTEPKKAKEKEKTKANAKEKAKESVLETPSGRFHAPTREEVAAYCLERGNKVDPERWFDYYSSNGWRVGKNPMKDWKAAVRTWERQDGQNTPRPAYQPKKHGLDRLMEQIQRGDYDDQE